MNPLERVDVFLAMVGFGPCADNRLTSARREAGTKDMAVRMGENSCFAFLVCGLTHHVPAT